MIVVVFLLPFLLLFAVILAIIWICGLVWFFAYNLLKAAAALVVIAVGLAADRRR